MIHQKKQKIRHSKLRNTGLLFELLVRQITTDTLNNKESKATGILRKYFNNNDISKEFKIYNTLSSAKNLSEGKASLLIESCISSYRKLNQANLKKQKYDLISEIKSNYDIDEFFKTKIDNYKTLASIYMLFEHYLSESIDEKIVTGYKYTILEGMLTKESVEKDELLEEFSSYDSGTRSLIYKTLLNKFNEKYKNFDPKQKSLLKEYINNISTSDKLKVYVNKEINEVSQTLNTIVSEIDDEVRKVKLQEVVSFLKPVEETKNVGDRDINNLLYSYELIKEYEKIKN